MLETLFGIDICHLTAKPLSAFSKHWISDVSCAWCEQYVLKQFQKQLYNVSSENQSTKRANLKPALIATQSSALKKDKLHSGEPNYKKFVLKLVKKYRKLQYWDVRVEKFNVF